MEYSDERDISFSDQVAALHARLAQLAENEPSPGADGVLFAELSSAHEELRVADEELRAQQAELDRLLGAHARSRGAQEQLIARLPAPVLITDAHGTIRIANSAASSLLSTRLHRLPRKPIFSFVDPTERSRLRTLLSKAVAEDETQMDARVTFLLEGRDPAELDVSATLQQTPDAPGGVEVTWVLLGAREGTATSTESAEPGLARTLVELAQMPQKSNEPGDVARSLAQLCRQAFPIPVRVSVTLGDPLMPSLLAADSHEAQLIDGAQLISGEGPCADAWRTGSRVSSTDMTVDARWPRLGSHLADVHLRAALAVPLVVEQKTAGVLNVYSQDVALASDPSGEAAELVASTVAAVLQEVSMRRELETVAEHMRAALDSRATIDQAKGIVMARHGCGPDEAFRILAKISTNSNVKLREIATRLVAEASHDQ